jgi:hypothetical protein
MTYAIDIVCIDAILIRLLRKLGLPETLPLIKLSPRIQNWIVHEAEGLRRNAMSHPTFAVLLAYGYALIVEHRYAWGLAQGMKDDGLVLS